MVWLVPAVCGAAFVLQLLVCLFPNAAACAVSAICHIALFVCLIFFHATAEQVFLCAMFSLTAYFVLARIKARNGRKKG